MIGQHRLAPSPEVLRHWRVVRMRLLALTAGVVLGSWWLMAAADTGTTASSGAPQRPPFATTSPQGLTSTTPTATTTTTPGGAATTASTAPIALAAGTGPGRLAPGSDPSVLPGPVLVADEDGHRVLIIDSRGRTMWQFPGPADIPEGQTFPAPDDAFFTPDGRQIIATGEDDHVISVIDIATRKIVYTYGTPGVAGSGHNQLRSPDGGLMLPSGELLVPDIKNCRILVIPPAGHTVSRQLGKTGACVHNPPQSFGSPNGLFPMSDGSYLLTESSGSWVSAMKLSGRVSWSAQLPGVSYLYESNEIGPDRYVTVDHALPGQVLTFDHTGRVLWRYAPTGKQALNMPSLAIPLPNGDLMVSDKSNHRLIVVDPRTNTVVWQYGHRGVAGDAPGFLNNPTGMDLYPPNALTVRNRATMGKIPR
jgi:DNA-binding beta-propeller fold protein YncE